MRKCLETQAWSGSGARCEGKNPLIIYRKRFDDITPNDEQVTYETRGGEFLSGKKRPENFLLNFVTEIRCSEPVIPVHSIISVTGNDRVYGRTLIRTSNDVFNVQTFKIGALVKYRCERGYKMVGDPLSTCEDSGQWKGEVPQCLCKLYSPPILSRKSSHKVLEQYKNYDFIVVDCGIPSELEHGQFTLVSNATYYGAAVLYECDDNYELSGFARRLCLENGSWSAVTPTCKGG